MESFVRVVRAGSFTVAANQLGLSRALVSRHVSDLEERLGVRLLTRSTRSVSLTEEGGAYLEFCERVFAEIDNNERAMARARLEPEGTLKVLAPQSFGSQRLSDAVMEFARVQPRLRISFFLENTPFRNTNEFTERGIDLAIRFTPMRGMAIVEREIARLEWTVCASPDYIARRGRPASVPELAQHDCIIHLNVSQNDNIWRFEGPDAVETVKVRGSFFSNSALMARKAALNGLGIAHVPRYAVGEDIDSGALVTVLPRHRVPLHPLLAVYPRAPVVARKVEVFVDFLTSWMAQQNFVHQTPARGRGRRVTAAAAARAP